MVNVKDFPEILFLHALVVIFGMWYGSARNGQCFGRRKFLLFLKGVMSTPTRILPDMIALLRQGALEFYANDVFFETPLFNNL